MKRSVSLIAFLLCICMVFSGCDSMGKEYGSRIYFINRGEGTSAQSALSWENHDISATDPEARVKELLAKMKRPSNPDNGMAIPWGVDVTGITLNSSTLTLDLTQSFRDLGELERSLLVSAVCMTVFGEEDIDYIHFTCRGESIDILGSGYFSRNSILTSDKNAESQMIEIRLFYISAANRQPKQVVVPFKTVSGELDPASLFCYLMAPVDDPEIIPPFEGRASLGVMTFAENLCTMDIIVDEDIIFRSADLICVAQTICRAPGVRELTLTINGQPPSIYGIRGMDGPQRSNDA